jgi:hypothetical protein
MVDLASANVDVELHGSVMNPILKLDVNAEASLYVDSRTESFRLILQNTLKFPTTGGFETGLDLRTVSWFSLLLGRVLFPTILSDSPIEGSIRGIGISNIDGIDIRSS